MFRPAILTLLLLTTASVAATVHHWGPSATAPSGGGHPAQRVDASAPVEPAPGPLDDDQTSVLAWAHRRFTEAGLTLPEMTVAFDPTRRACHGAEGLYRFDGTSHHVAISTRESRSFAAELQRRRTLLHEFAHAWDTLHLSDAEREALNERFGTSAWADPGDEWTDRGAEHLAETFVFGLLDHTRRALRIDRRCTQLVDDFRDLSGADVLGPDRPACLPTHDADAEVSNPASGRVQSFRGADRTPGS